MQRMGGGSRKRGGGNDPRCGCDMRVGWDLSFGDVKQAGGSCNGSCSAGFLPQTGGGCGCQLFKGGKTRKSRRGGGLLFANGGGDNMNPAPVDFKGFGVTLSNTRANVSSIANYNKKGGASDLNPAPVDFKGFGVTLSNTRANVRSIANYNGKGGANCDFPCPFRGTGYCDFYAKGGANYGEPLSLQAKLRGGANNKKNANNNNSNNNNNNNENNANNNTTDLSGYNIQIRNRSLSANNIENAQNYYNNQGYNSNALSANNIEYLKNQNAGGVNGCGCLSNPLIRGYGPLKGGSDMMEDLRQLRNEIDGFLANIRPARAGQRITPSQYNDLVRRESDIITMYDQIKENYNLGGAQDSQEIALIDEVHAKLLRMAELLDTYEQNFHRGGYKATKKNLKYLKKYKQGKSIGFTMTSSLKAKGLIPRSSRKNRGKKIVSAKYK